MKNTKKYCLLFLVTAFYTVFNSFAMEQAISNSSGEWLQQETIDESNSSNESGMNPRAKELLEERIKTLQRVDSTIIETLKDQGTSGKIRRKSIERLNFINDTIIMANDMVLGHKPIDMRLINQKVNVVIPPQNQNKKRGYSYEKYKKKSQYNTISCPVRIF